MFSRRKKSVAAISLTTEEKSRPTGEGGAGCGALLAGKRSEISTREPRNYRSKRVSNGRPDASQETPQGNPSCHISSRAAVPFWGQTIILGI